VPLQQSIFFCLFFLFYCSSVWAVSSVAVLSPNGSQTVNGLLDVQLGIQNDDDSFVLDLNISRLPDVNGLVVFNDVNWAYLGCEETTFVPFPVTCHFFLQTNAYPDGNYFVRAALEDNGTVVTGVSNSSFYIDNHAPTIVVENPVGTTMSRTVVFRVEDNSYLDNDILVFFDNPTRISVFLDRGLPNAIRWGMQQIDSNGVWSMSDAYQVLMFGKQEIFDDSDGRVSPLGSWTRFSSPYSFGGSYLIGKEPGETLAVDFTGNAISMLAVVNASGGKNKVIIDGRSDLANQLPVDKNGNAFVDYYSTSTDYNRLIPIADGLPDGSHQLILEILDTGNDRNMTFVTGFVDQNYLRTFSSPFTYTNKRKIVRGTGPGTANEYVYWYGGPNGNFVGNGHFYDKIQWDADGKAIDLFLDGQPAVMVTGESAVVHSFEFDENTVLSRPVGEPDQNIGDVQRKEIFSNKGLDVNYSVRWFNTGTPYTLTVCYISMLSLQNDRNVSQFGYLNGQKYFFLMDGSFSGNVVATSNIFSTSFDNLVVGAELLNSETSYVPFTGKNTFFWSRPAGNANKVYYDICNGTNDIMPTEDQTFTVKSRYTIDYNTADAGTEIGAVSVVLMPGPASFDQTTACTENPTSSRLYCSYVEPAIVVKNNWLSITASDASGSYSSFQQPFIFLPLARKVDSWPQLNRLTGFE
jgi:hypothetical protein